MRHTADSVRGGNSIGLCALLALAGAFAQLTTHGLLAANPSALGTYERARPGRAGSPVDELVQARLLVKGILPARLCSDEVFVRRAYLDVCGTLPVPEQVRSFLQDGHSGKRARLIDALLEREEFADYWSLKWCDLLRVKAEFPSNLWPNAVQAYHRWVHDALRKNMPYDQFVRALLVASGSGFRQPAVNFYRAVENRKPEGLAAAVALTFMGMRFARWSASERQAMVPFFSLLSYKQTSEWKEEIVENDPAPAPGFDTTFPDGKPAHVEPDRDPREVFANWLVMPGNPWLSRAVVNRIWAWLMGRGLVHEPDDLRPDNPPVHPDVLAYLESELESSHYDLRHVFRVILNSDTYQQSCIPRDAHPDAAALFAYYPTRQLDAEVLIDAICSVTGVYEDYSSAIPEPYTFIPESRRSILLADGSTTSPFLEMFGRPARDTGLESERNSQPSEAQRMHLLNASHIQRKINSSERLQKLGQTALTDTPAVVRVLYLGILSRYPSEQELSTALESFAMTGKRPQVFVQDLTWALFNTKEFLYRH